VKIINGEEHIEARVRGTFGGNVVNFQGATSTNTADYPLMKTLWCGVLSDVKHKDPNTKCVNLDMTDYYLYAPLEDPGYMAVPINEIPPEIVKAYGLEKYASKGKVYFIVYMSMYGHPAAGLLANRLFWKTIEPAGYYEDPNVPCLIQSKTNTIQGALVVDDITAKYSNPDEVLHLVAAIEKVWKVKINWAADRFCGLDLKWDYNPINPSLEFGNDRVVDDYFKRFLPDKILKGAETPGIYNNPKFHHNGTPELIDPEPEAKLEHKTEVQQKAGTLNHQGRTSRYDIVTAVNTIAETQSSPTDLTLKQVDQLENYISRYSYASVRFEATDMELRAHYDSSLKPHARHKAGVVIYLANKDDPPDKIGNIIEVISKTPPGCIASIAEGEYNAQFIATQGSLAHRTVVEALGYPQPPIKIYGDNSTAIGIANDAVKVKRSKAFDKTFHYTRDKVRTKDIESIKIDTKDNASDFFTKFLSPSEHKRQASKLVKFKPNRLSKK
jgi:hypothetical protein